MELFSLIINPSAALARIEQIKAAFRREPGTNKMSSDPEKRALRNQVTTLLVQIGYTAADTDEDLSWQTVRPERSEEDADPHLRELLTLFLQLFGVPDLDGFLKAVSSNSAAPEEAPAHSLPASEQVPTQ